MPDPTKPISASNPPESRGQRGAKDDVALTIENTVTGENDEADRNLVYEPTTVSPSPASPPAESPASPAPSGKAKKSK